MALNAGKLIDEGKEFFDVLRNPPKETHASLGMNNVVEATKASPYFAGHLLYWLLITPVLAVVWRCLAYWGLTPF